MKTGIAILIVLILTGCSSDDSYIEIPEPNVETNEDYTSYCTNHNRWIYQEMSNHYYWYKEMPDSSMLDFTLEPSLFFTSLKSSQDRFSWCEENVNYVKKNSMENNTGFEYQTYKVCGSKVNRILYVYSPYLLRQGLKRGDFINLSLQKKHPVIEKGYLKNNRFVVQSTIPILSSTTRGSNLSPTVSLDSIYAIDNKKIGYFVYNQFESSTDVSQIAIRLKNYGIDDLILDLRYNPGGYVSTSNYLASMLAPAERLGSLYQLQRYNDKLTKEKQKNGGSGVDSVFLNKGSITLQRNLNLPRLVVLTTKNSASASESLIIGLRPYMKVVTIGTTSCGKDVGSYTIADNNYKYQLQPITFKYYNALNESTPTTGIVPDIYVEDDLDHQRGDTNEALLKAAIEYLTGETPHGAVKARSASQPKMQEVGRSSIEIKNNL